MPQNRGYYLMPLCRVMACEKVKSKGGGNVFRREGKSEGATKAPKRMNIKRQDKRNNLG